MDIMYVRQRCADIGSTSFKIRVQFEDGSFGAWATYTRAQIREHLQTWNDRVEALPPETRQQIDRNIISALDGYGYKVDVSTLPASVNVNRWRVVEVVPL